MRRQQKRHMQTSVVVGRHVTIPHDAHHAFNVVGEVIHDHQGKVKPRAVLRTADDEHHLRALLRDALRHPAQEAQLIHWMPAWEGHAAEVLHDHLVDVFGLSAQPEPSHDDVVVAAGRKHLTVSLVLADAPHSGAAFVHASHEGAARVENINFTNVGQHLVMNVSVVVRLPSQEWLRVETGTQHVPPVIVHNRFRRLLLPQIEHRVQHMRLRIAVHL
mmetsp:Transcript_66156/g.175326  ORF Transcript_66156/g.175326 Transcript_66156/m.175326 type:complete len:217 (-) Transcript_66156:2882-3532(-)